MTAEDAGAVMSGNVVACFPDERIDPRLRRHVESRTVVLPELRLLYLPVPKTGWTSLLWVLADLAGIPRHRFMGAEDAETTLTMAVHDRQIWRESGRRLADMSDADRHLALTEDGWFRFTVVREPASRLWSAWQSKLLRREPHFARRFRDRPWFPTFPETANDVVRDFHAFIAALDEEWAFDSIRDPHWMPQYEIASTLPLNHVGRLERMDETYAALRAHLRGRAEVRDDLPRDNRMPLPFSPAAYDEHTAAIVNKRYADDFSEYGYPPLEVGGPPESEDRWREQVVVRLPAAQAVIDSHERLAAWDEVARERRRELRRTSKQLARAETKRAELAERLAAEKQKRGALERRVGVVAGERDALRSKLDRTYRSRSWRWTAPMRAAFRFLARLRRR